MYTLRKKNNMNRSLRYCHFLLAGIIFTFCFGSSALASEAFIGYIPSVMSPGTEIIFDGSTELTDVSDGLVKPYHLEIPPNLSESMSKYISLEEKTVEANFNQRIPLDTIPIVIYPDMKVVYDEGNGEINNIYYFSVDSGEYVLHNDNYNDELETHLNDIVNDIEIPTGNESIDVTVSDIIVSSTRIGTRGQVLKNGDCLIGGKTIYRKMGEHDLAVRNLVLGNSRVFYYERGKAYINGISLTTVEDAVNVTQCRDISYPTKIRFFWRK